MSGTRWFFVFLIGFSLLSFWVTSLREDPPPFTPTPANISKSEKSQEEEIPVQVI